MIPDFMRRKDAQPPKPKLAVATAQEAPSEAGTAEQGKVQAHPDPEQRKKYEALHVQEEKIAAAIKNWVQHGKALKAIHDEALYAGLDASFEDYLARRWTTKRRQAYALMAAAVAAQNLRERKVQHMLSGRAAAVLAKLNDQPDKQAECLRRAIAGHGSLSPPADYLRAAVAACLGESARPRKKTKPKKPKLARVRLENGETVTVRSTKAIADVCDLLRRALAAAELAEIENPKSNPGAPGQNRNPSAATSRP